MPVFNSNIVTSFTWGDFIPNRRRTAEILTQKSRFCLYSRFWSWKKQKFIWCFSFSKPVNLGTPVRKISFRKRRPRNKQRTKNLQRKYYCSTSHRVLYAVFVLEIRLLVSVSNWLFFNIKLPFHKFEHFFKKSRLYQNPKSVMGVCSRIWYSKLATWSLSHELWLFFCRSVKSVSAKTTFLHKIMQYLFSIWKQWRL